MQTAQIPAGNSERPVYIFPENQILMFLWRIGNQEQARTVADHFAFSVDSSCIIISGKKDNLKRLTEIFEKNFRIRSIPFDFEKNFRKFWSDGTRPTFPQNGTKSDNLQTSAMELHRTFLTNKLLSVWKM